MTGKLYGIGLGPGDSELLTLKALRILQSSKIVAYPAPDNGNSFARQIAAPFLNGEHIEIPIIIPMRIERFPAEEIYDQAADRISAHLTDNHDVVVLCEGDPFFYGSFMYLYQRLARKFECEVIPGVSSVMAASAVLGRPLAGRNDILTIIPAPLSDQEIKNQLEHSDAAAIIKLGKHFSRINSLLSSMGLTSQAAYLERISLPEQRIFPLAEMPDNKAPYFSLILIYKGPENWTENWAENWTATLPLPTRKEGINEC